MNDFDYSIIKDIKPLKKKKGSKSRYRYGDIVCAFDIETTSVKSIKQAVMYVWQFQLGLEYTIIGRTWEEFRLFYDTVNDLLDDMTLVVYVHNLSYEFQWLKSVLPVDTIMAMDLRKILKFNSGMFEFRCSYIHSNMSLDRFLKEMKVSHKKVEGFDYNKERYYFTPLTDSELEYIINDVLGLVEAIYYELENDQDDLYSICLTLTGYVRREMKEILAPFNSYIKAMLPNAEVMTYLRKAFRGGNTHGNMYYAKEIVEESDSDDISSSYPYQMMTLDVPMEAFKEVPPSYFEKALRYNKACLYKIILTDVKLKNELWGIPYLAESKLEYVEGEVVDNGRVRECDICVLYGNEYDFSIISNEYDFNYKIEKLFIARKDKLPKQLRSYLLDLYRQKTLLKGTGDDFNYFRAKVKLNSAYGCMVLNPLKPRYIFEDGNVVINEEETIEELMEDYQKNGWLNYAWGVWVTSGARYLLECGLNCFEPEQVLYVDTDSIKYVGDGSLLQKLNDEIRDDRLSAVDSKGNKHYLGIFEYDGHYKRFCHMGAKKYCYEDDDNKLHITISGVGKKEGAKELGKIENFKEGFIFKEAGGTESIYNDSPDIKQIRKEGKTIDIISNIYIQDSTYTLGIGVDYERLLNGLMDSDIRYSLHFER